LAEAPIATWLHLASAPRPTVVTVTFIGTHKSFSLTRVQAQRLHHALGEALARIVREDGSPDGKAIKLSQGDFS